MYLQPAGEKVKINLTNMATNKQLVQMDSGSTASWDEHPDRDEEWKQQELGRIHEERFRREYGCEFLVFDETLIHSIMLSTLEGKEPNYEHGTNKMVQKINPPATYVVDPGPAMGTGGDALAIQVFELPILEQVAEWKHNMTAIPIK